MMFCVYVMLYCDKMDNLKSPKHLNTRQLLYNFLMCNSGVRLVLANPTECPLL